MKNDLASREDFEYFKKTNPEKMQVRIPNWTYKILDYDLNNYNIGNKSISNLVSMVLMSINKYRDYENEIENKLMDSVNEYISNVYKIKDSIDSDKYRKKYLKNTVSLLIERETKIFDNGTTRIDIHKTISNSTVLRAIENLLDGDTTATSYIKKMLMLYALQPAYIREQILFSRTYEDACNIVKDDKAPYYDVTMKSGKLVHIKPYEIVCDPDGIHNYLLGITYFNDREGKTIYKATSIRLDNIETNINKAFYTNNKETSAFSDEEKNTLELMKKNHPAYAYFSLNNDKYKLRFSEVVTNKYEKVYTQRPKYIEKVKNDDGTYDFTFDCSSKQMNQYLIRLMTSLDKIELENASIEILEPKGFKDNFKDYYLKFVNVLKD